MSPQTFDGDGTIVVSQVIGRTSSSRRTTCDICRERKVRCNKEHPCERCTRLKLKCTYTHQSDPLDVSKALVQLHERLQQAEAALAAARSQPLTPSAQDASTILGDWEMATNNIDSDYFMSFLADASPNFEGLRSRSMTIEGMNPVEPQQTPAHSSPENIATEIEIPGTGTGIGTPVSIESSQSFRQSTLTTSLPLAASSYPPLRPHDAPLLSSGPEGAGIGSHILHLVHQRYFEATQTMPDIINRNRFYWTIGQFPGKHHVSALSNAVAMAGAALSEDFPNIETFFYHAARRHIEEAELEDNDSSFQNVEIVQALLLILRFELTETKSLARAWMTHGRAMRLLQMLSLDIADAGDTQLPCQTLRVARASPMTWVELEEIRRTFWISFCLDFHVSALMQTAPMLKVDEIFTYVPVTTPSETELSPNKTFLKNIVNEQCGNANGVFSPLIFATGIGNQVLQHLSMSASPQYDFWRHHFSLNRKLSECIGGSTLYQSQSAMKGDKIIIMTHFTLLGIVILLHIRAYKRALQTACSEGLLAESWRRCESTATEISDLLSLDAGFGQVRLKTYKSLGLYLSWPVSLAARVQIMRIGDIGRWDSNFDPSVYLATPLSQPSPQQLTTIQSSLAVLESTLRALGTSSTQFDGLLKTIRTLLNSLDQSTTRMDQDCATQRRHLGPISSMDRMNDFC